MSVIRPEISHGAICSQQPCERCLFVLGLRVRAAALARMEPVLPVATWTDLSTALSEAAELITKLQEEDASRGRLIAQLVEGGQ